jgi:rhodanese-related sulfurtransferase
VFERLDLTTAQARLASGALLVDVRERDEFAQAHVAGATLIPLSEFAERLQELPPARDIILMCAAGVRSANAAHYASGQGYHVANLEGGITAWWAAGLPIISDNEPSEEKA